MDACRLDQLGKERADLIGGRITAHEGQLAIAPTSPRVRRT
jgi:hypothetical protein